MYLSDFLKSPVPKPEFLYNSKKAFPFPLSTYCFNSVPALIKSLCDTGKSNKSIIVSTSPDISSSICSSNLISFRTPLINVIIFDSLIPITPLLQLQVPISDVDKFLTLPSLVNKIPSGYAPPL